MRDTMHTGNTRDEPLTHLPDTTQQLLAFGGELVQRTPDATFQLAGYAWQGSRDGVDVGESLYYVKGDGLDEGISRASVRASRGTLGRRDAGGGTPLTLATHLYDVLCNDPRTTNDTDGLWEQLPSQLAAINWESVTAHVNGLAATGRRSRYEGLNILHLEHGDQLVTAIGPAAFTDGPFETITSLPRIPVGPRAALIR